MPTTARYSVGPRGSTSEGIGSLRPGCALENLHSFVIFLPLWEAAVSGCQRGPILEKAVDLS